MKAAILILAILAAPGEIGAFVTACTPDALRLCTAEQLAAALIVAMKWISIERTDEDNGEEVNSHLDKMLKQFGDALAAYRKGKG